MGGLLYSHSNTKDYEKQITTFRAFKVNGDDDLSVNPLITYATFRKRALKPFSQERKQCGLSISDPYRHVSVCQD